jgi:cytochrome c oxidase assembly factor CtaG
MRLIALALALWPALVLAHDAPPESVYRGATVVALVMLAALYAAALRQCTTLRSFHAVAFASGWAALAFVLVTPVSRIASESFSVHMIQHEVLMIVAPPLLILGRPFTALAATLPRSVVRILAWPLRPPPFVAWMLHAAAIWIWHVPRLFDAGGESAGVHALQHACFFFSAMLFWWTVFRRVRTGVAVLYVLTTMIYSGALAALLTLAPGPLYAGTTLEQQQLGGLIMWVPAGFAMLVAGLVAFDRMFASQA